MKKKLLIHCLHEEHRVALLEDDRLVEYMIERPEEQRLVGNLYRGRVINVLPGMQAAFVDIGGKRNAFLYVDDVLLAKGIRKEENQSIPTISQLVSSGDEVLVQVMKEPTGNKGARLTMNISLPGRYLVYLPFGGYIGISRRIVEELERERLKEVGESLLEGTEGLIMRTLCEGITEEELREDLQRLRARWQGTRRANIGVSAPILLYREVDLLPRIVRDYLSTEITAVYIDDRTAFLRLQEELRGYPELLQLLHLYAADEPLFDFFKVSVEIERALKPRVWLKSGGYIILEQTEALTVVDVNTGKFTGSHNLEQTVFQTNVEAAKEIARQLRIRDIGGIIIIDFIDMEEEEHQQAVLRELEKALSYDRTKTNLVGLTSLGLVELTRKKIRQSLLEVSSKPCPQCEGKGYLLL